MNKLFTILICTSVIHVTVAQETDSAQILIEGMQLYLDSVENSLHYQRGEIKLENDLGTLNIPEGFQYLDSKQSAYIIHDFWGNPHGDGTLGMIVPENIPITDPNGWAFIITYDEIGYVKDDDAEDIEYDELLKEMQGEAAAENPERIRQGYESIAIIGWASKPYYDKEKNVLHWAKEIKFGENEMNTLNYNVRILGRKGVLVLNAVASMGELPEVQQNIDPVLASFSYADGNKYADFDPDIDEVAAWTIGGLVAGKVLAKAGFFALILKNIKLIIFGLMGIGGAALKWFKRKTEPPTVRNIGGESTPS